MNILTVSLISYGLLELKPQADNFIVVNKNQPLPMVSKPHTRKKSTAFDPTTLKLKIKVNNAPKKTK